MTNHPPKAAIIGGGVIGGGWAARFLLHGWDVTVFDPDPQSQRKIEEVMTNARSSLPSLIDAPLPNEGILNYSDTVATAVADAQWVQESIPERLELKQKVLNEIAGSISTDCVVGSSTSGFKPSQMCEDLSVADQFVVAHPFNPVYLLPLVEIVPSPTTSPGILGRAKEILTELGMKPLVVRKEIDAHIADRLLEAVWRECLWLVKDGIATTGEIDDAIRYGFGLRWAQMGIFDTYRVAGGEAGMSHFLAQFGPALKWPWTKLMDVPELDQALIDTISKQSDDQSAQYTIREMERIRDENLVAIMKALKGKDWASGALLNEHEKRLRKNPN